MSKSIQCHIRMTTQTKRELETLVESSVSPTTSEYIRQLVHEKYQEQVKGEKEMNKVRVLYNGEPIGSPVIANHRMTIEEYIDLAGIDLSEEEYDIELFDISWNTKHLDEVIDLNDCYYLEDQGSGSANDGNQTLFWDDEIKKEYGHVEMYQINDTRWISDWISDDRIANVGDYEYRILIK